LVLNTLIYIAMKEFIEYLIKEIVNVPQSVTVDETKDGDLFVFNIVVDPQDMGIVIGKGGKNIRSIRNMAKAKAIIDNIHIKIELEESDENYKDNTQETEENDQV
jgi:predicted RNA-binding protein YlqC (UPF0109 family)